MAGPLRLPLLALLSALPLVSCGEGPKKLSRAEVEAEKARGEAPAGLASEEGELPPGHPPMGGQEPASPHPPMGGAAGPGGAPTALEGVVELAGPFAELETGSVYLVGYDRATGSMALVRKYELSQADRSQPGQARVRFSMDQVHPTATGSLVDIDLEVRIDLDGFVETAEDIVARTRVPAQLGDRDVTVRVDDTARTGAPLPEPGTGG